MDSREWSVLGSEVVFDDMITVVKDRLRNPDGSEMHYRYLASNGSSSVLAFIDNGQVVLTRQYRHPLRKVLYDLPAGGIRDGEAPLDAARRELAEETGYVAGTIEPLGSYNPLPGTMNHRCHVFTAHDLRPGPSNPDENEVIEVVQLRWQDLVRLVLTGETVDGSLAYAVLRYLARSTALS